MLHKELLGVESRTASGSGCTHGLAIARVGTISCGEHTFHISVCSGAFHPYIALLVEFYLPTENLCIGAMSDSKEESVDCDVKALLFGPT